MSMSITRMQDTIERLQSAKRTIAQNGKALVREGAGTLVGGLRPLLLAEGGRV